MHVGLKPHYFVINRCKSYPSYQRAEKFESIKLPWRIEFIYHSFFQPLVKMQFWIKTNDFQNFNIVIVNTKTEKSVKIGSQALNYDDVQPKRLISGTYINK